MRGKDTELAQRLNLPETRPTAIANAVAAYRAGGTLEKAATILGVSPRTLKRLVASHPELDSAIKDVREERS